MPLEQLKNYQGISPRPADFDDFWDKSIAEMKAVEPNLELKPSDFQVPNADCMELRFTGVGGSRIYAKYLKPKNIDKPVPLIIMFHGYTCSSGNWNDKLAFVSQGYAVVALDSRGQSGFSEDLGGTHGITFRGHIIRGLSDNDPKKLLFRQNFLDTAQLAGIIMDFDEIDETRVGVYGGSQGGALSLVCAALEPRIKMATVAYPFLSDYKRVWQLELPTMAYMELREYFRYYDPLHEKEDEIFNLLSYIDIQHLMPRIKADVLFGVGLMDDTCPPSTSFAAYNKLQTKKELLIYPDFGHENLTGFWDKAFMFQMGL